MNTYTQDEVSLLCASINAWRDNINQSAVKTKLGEMSFPTPYWDVYTVEEVLNQIIRFISLEEYQGIVRATIEDWPLEDMPLFINETDGRQIIAHWRLEIAK